MEKSTEHASGTGGDRPTPQQTSAFTEEQLAQLQAAHNLAIQQAVSQAVGTLTEQLQERDSRVRILEQLLTTHTANLPVRPSSRSDEDNATVRMELGKLPFLQVDGKNWQTFSLKFKAHIANTSEEAYEELERLEDPAEEPKPMTEMTGTLRGLARKIHFGLTMLTEGTSLTLVDGVRDKNGFTAYSKLSTRWDPASQGRNLDSLTKLLHWDFGSGRDKMLDALAAWEKAVERWEFRSGEPLQDSVKQSVISASSELAQRDTN